MKKWCAMILVVCCLPIAGLFVSCGGTEQSGLRYEITAEYLPESKSLYAVQKFTYENRSDSLKESLSFQLYPNAYRKDAIKKPVSAGYRSLAYYNGESYGDMTITSVLGGKLWEIGGEDDNILIVTLEKPLSMGDTVVLDISFVLRLADVNHRTGVSEKAVNLGNFFPILCADDVQGFIENAYHNVGDPFLSACAEYKVSLTVPKTYTVAATGMMKETRELESKKQVVYQAESVRDFAITLSTNYQVLQDKIGKTDVFYYYVDDANPKEKLTAITQSLSYFSSVFGEYPYTTYSVAQTGFCMGGMEYPALTFLSSSLTGLDALQALVHETAHQWWYAAVGSDQINQAWQDEGLTEYSTILFFDAHPDYGLKRTELVAQSVKACRAYQEIYGSILGADGKMSKGLDEYLSDYAYRVLAYDKGVVLFDNLRQSVGDKKFFAGLRKYYAAEKYKIASVGSLIGAFERVGVDVGGLFDCFLQGKVVI